MGREVVGVVGAKGWQGAEGVVVGGGCGLVGLLIRGGERGHRSNRGGVGM